METSLRKVAVVRVQIVYHDFDLHVSLRTPYEMTRSSHRVRFSGSPLGLALKPDSRGMSREVSFGPSRKIDGASTAGFCRPSARDGWSRIGISPPPRARVAVRPSGIRATRWIGGRGRRWTGADRCGTLVTELGLSWVGRSAP